MRNMIRSGKVAGWLQLPSAAFLPWAKLNHVEFTRSTPGSIDGRGNALIATEALDGADDKRRDLLTIPRDLILSLERIQEHAKVDRDFREVLECLGEFGRTARGAILSFLLFQVSVSCPDISSKVGVHNPFVDYVKSLPLEDLPTFWSQSELALLAGTTLAPAVSSKLRSLRREYDRLCSAAAQTRWFRSVESSIDFDDWCQVDAMYRSRALEFPEIGHCMIPCLDLANHASHESTIAVYDKDGDGNAILLLRDTKQIASGDEITITYGDEKGACEMIFSYGFLEPDRKTAETLFLSLAIPDDDPAQSAKIAAADCAPGFKIIDAADGDFDWSGDFIWMLCVNQDDGLRFELARTVDGTDEEVQAFFGDVELIGGAAQLRALLAKGDLWDVYRLRAIAILQQRVFDQLQILFTTQDAAEAVEHGTGTEVATARFTTAMQLRRLEFDMMERAYEWFENEKNELAASPVVQQYLADMNREPESIPPEAHETDEDFS